MTAAACHEFEPRSPALTWLLARDIARREGLWCEFGVGDGASLRQLVANRGNARVVGFDWFYGLPEDWRPGFAKGDFSRMGIAPDVPGAEIVVGLFADTLPSFNDRGQTLNLLHVDCDLYSSTATALRWARPLLADGSVIVFDELRGYPGWEKHEWRALQDEIERGLRVELVCGNPQQVVYRVRA